MHFESLEAAFRTLPDSRKAFASPLEESVGRAQILNMNLRITNYENLFVGENF